MDASGSINVEEMANIISTMDELDGEASHNQLGCIGFSKVIIVLFFGFVVYVI